MHNEEILQPSNIFEESRTWIYESPDFGKTVHKRLIGSPNKITVNGDIEDNLQDKLGVDIIKKVTKAVGE